MKLHGHGVEIKVNGVTLWIRSTKGWWPAIYGEDTYFYDVIKYGGILTRMGPFLPPGKRPHSEVYKGRKGLQYVLTKEELAAQIDHLMNKRKMQENAYNQYKNETY